MTIEIQTNTDARPRKRWLLQSAQIAWVLFVALTLVLYGAGVVVYFSGLRQICAAPPAVCGEYDYPTALGAAQLAVAGLSLDMYALLVVGFRVLYSLIPIGLGLLIFARKRTEPFALVVSLFLITFGMAGGPLVVLSAAYPALQGLTTLIQYVGAISLPLFFGLFPNGRMVPRFYWLVVIYFGGAYVLGDILQWDSINDPLASFISYSMWLSVLLGGVAAQGYRYARVSTPEEKRQTRWVLFGMGLMAIALVTLLVVTAVIGDPTIGTSSDANLVRRMFFLIGLSLIFQVVYVFIGIAILRSKLFDIDILIRKTVTYAIVVALLAIVYFGSVILLQQLFAAVSGQRSEVITVLSTLAIAILFVPLRNRIQNAIDKRFYRKKYDAQKVLEKFAETVRDETDLDKLTAELVNVVQETMQPRSVSVWLKRGDGETGRQGNKK